MFRKLIHYIRHQVTYRILILLCKILKILIVVKIPTFIHKKVNTSLIFKVAHYGSYICQSWKRWD